jgi:hypothetical protein
MTCRECEGKQPSPNFNILSQNLSGGNEGSQENLGQDSGSPGLDLKPGPPEYETGVLTSRLRSSISSDKEAVPY